MYAIANLIYGFDLTDHPSQPMWEAICEVIRENPSEFGLDDLDPEGVEFFTSEEGWDDLRDNISETEMLWSAYRGSGDGPLAFGVRIGAFDECSNVPFAELQEEATLTPQHQKEWEALLTQFPTFAQALNKRNLQPQVMVIWGSS